MAYLLGRDVKVCVTTESDDRGVTISSGAVTLTAEGSISAGAANVLPARDVSAPLVSNAMADVTGIDITMGTVDEDIAYLGQRTALKAEIKKRQYLSQRKRHQIFSVIYLHVVTDTEQPQQLAVHSEHQQKDNQHPQMDLDTEFTLC